MKNRYVSKLVFSDPIMSVYEIIDTKTLYSFLICDDKNAVDKVEKLLNKQDKEIKRYKYALSGFIGNCGSASCKLKNNKTIEVLEKVKEFIDNQINELRGGK